VWEAKAIYLLKTHLPFVWLHSLSSEGTHFLLKLQWGSERSLFLLFKLSYFIFSSQRCVILVNEG